MSTSDEPHSLLNCSVKELADYSISGAASLPSVYFSNCPAVPEAETVVNEEIPTIDVSLLKHGTPEERSRVILDIGRACEEWGCFNVVNHGVSESLQTAMMEAFSNFFNLTEEEKKYYTQKTMFEPVVHGTSTNLMGKEVRFWRDFLRVFVYPVFHSPDKPHDFRTISEEYAHKTREIYNELLRAIWESLDLDVSFMEESLELKSSCQTLVGNLYPPCPQPELVLGLPPHSDPCLVTLLMQNKGFNGLQVLHNGKWIVIQIVPRSFLFLTGDIIEIVSNGRYKSIVHRVMVSSESTRISVGTQVTPPIENVTFAPAPKLLERSNCSTIFRGITFKEFFALKYQHKSVNSIMDFLKVNLKNNSMRSNVTYKSILYKKLPQLCYVRKLYYHVWISCVKEFADYGGFEATGLPSLYMTRNPAISEAETIVKEEIPTVDFALLRNGSQDERLRMIHDIKRACKEWGCFTLFNHGMSESLRTAMIEAFAEFFDLTTEEKQEYNIKNVFDSVSHGTSYSLTMKEERYWRDFLRIHLHPEFNSPAKPPGFRKISEEFGRQSREILSEVLRAIWGSLELEVSFMEESLELKSSNQILVGNLYPPCPQPELVLGMPPHSDPCLLTLLMQNNAFNGLQVLHNGRWVETQLITDSFLILTGDFLEIVSNGRYKSICHRVMVSSESTRISVGTALSPPLENIIVPAPRLVEGSNSPAVFRGITFKEFVALKCQNISKSSVMDLINKM
ncbi:hypothetical protein IEQ34_019306 [Dendrobium chrysotoxum]|uniref:Fe2OG dioxygenase domain-containing protein n=1 Tax=Dendrobium chrysotoxum TaxID=161865 RepID=A0AAV7G732_DENCH|nr:hypothetical protein IEQ34_019306 [Dendrobium chrysotoxum]